MKKLIALVIALLIILFSWNWISAKRSISIYAAKVQPGMELSLARTYAGQMGLKYVSSSHRDEAGVFHDLVTSSGVMGRYVCEVQHDGSTVKITKMQFHD